MAKPKGLKEQGFDVAQDAKPEDTKAVSIEIAQPPFLIQGRPIARLTIERMTFSQFSRVCRMADAAAVFNKAENNNKFFLREKLKMQLRFHAVDGTIIVPTDDAILQLPRQYAVTVTRATEQTADPIGELLSDGDGIGSPVLYRLGTPIKTSTGDISELEFTARTLGDIEDVLAADRRTDQVLELIRTCAKPIGAQEGLLALPSWGAEQITLTDGLILMDQVLPRFLD